MIRHILTVFLVLALLLTALPAMGENTEPLTAEETVAFLSSIRERALESTPLKISGPSDDGYAFDYDFATLWTDSPEITESTAVRTAVISTSAEETLRGITLNDDLDRILAAWPCSDPMLPGSNTVSVLYLSGNASSGFSYGRVLRDGQRIDTVEYAAVLPAPGGYSVQGITFTLQSNLTSAIRVYEAEPVLTPEETEELYASLCEDSTKTDYTRVFSGYDVSLLTVMAPEDLFFSGIDYCHATAEGLPDVLEDMWMDNENGTWLHIVDGSDYTAVFRTDEDRSGAEMISFTIHGDGMEGPRCVRIGDSFTEDFYRFRSGDGAYDEASMTEVLYRTDTAAGIAVYGNSVAELRYSVLTEDGRTVNLLLTYEDYLLTEITVWTAE